MAQVREVRLIDDLDGDEAKHEVEFAIAGKAYKIDLSEENKQRFDGALAEFVHAAQPLGKAPKLGRGSGNQPVLARQRRPAEPKTTPPPVDPSAEWSRDQVLAAGERLRKKMDSQARAAVRAWAQGKGLDVGERGKLPSDMLVAYARENMPNWLDLIS